MKKIPLSIFILLSIIFMVSISCDDGFRGCKRMPKQVIGTGEIIPDAKVVFDVSVPTDINLPTPKEMIITSDSLNIYNAMVRFDNGTTYNPIDFSQYTVLAHYTSGGCYAVFERKVTKNFEKQKYIYKIKVIICGTCQRNWGSENWVLIPKIEENYTVDFIVEEEWRK